MSIGPHPTRGGIPIGTADDLFDLCDDTVGCMSRLHRAFGELVAFPKGGELTLFAFGPEASESLFADPDLFHVHGQPGPRNSSMRRFGLGLFGQNGSPMQQARKRLLPALSKSAVTLASGFMEALVKEQLETWRVHQTFDLSAEMKKLALRITGRLLFGLESFAVADRVAATFQTWLDDYIRVLLASAFPIELPASRYRNWLAAGDRLEAELRELIDQRCAILRGGQTDVLAVLLRARAAGELSDADLMGQVHTLFNAAYQTTASGLLWALLMLEQHPDVLRLIVRQDAAMLDRAIRESLRLFPPVLFVLRRATRAAVVAGHPVPKGTVVFLGLYVTHRFADIYPDPERYHPDRWLSHAASPYAYIPFGAGPRMCLGTAFSRQLFQSAIGGIVRRYRLALAPYTAVNRHTSLTLGVTGALPVTLLPRDDRYEAVPLVGNIHDMVRLPGLRPSIALPKAA